MKVRAARQRRTLKKVGRSCRSAHYSIDWKTIDWNALERLRAAFLEGTAGERDYWQSERDLASYDATFAQRIGWKWDYVLHELKRRGWSPPEGELLDWGCGSGIAHRAFLDHFGTSSVAGLRLWDRSGRAMQFAQRKAQEKYPALKIAPKDDFTFSSILLSHVITELSENQLDELLSLTAKATSILWVEPGTYEASRALIGVREKLLRSQRIEIHRDETLGRAAFSLSLRDTSGRGSG